MFTSASPSPWANFNNLPVSPLAVNAKRVHRVTVSTDGHETRYHFHDHIQMIFYQRLGPQLLGGQGRPPYSHLGPLMNEDAEPFHPVTGDITPSASGLE